jgi:hypothetical protein
LMPRDLAKPGGRKGGGGLGEVGAWLGFGIAHSESPSSISRYSEFLAVSKSLMRYDQDFARGYFKTAICQKRYHMQRMPETRRQACDFIRIEPIGDRQRYADSPTCL